MHQQLNTAAQELIDESVRAAESYFSFTNNLLGIVGFPIGIGCISTENPIFYAFLSVLFLWTVWGFEIRAYKRKLQILRSIKHQSMTPWAVIKRSPAALISMLFLGCIATGWLDNSGPSFSKHQGQSHLSNSASANGKK
jgi:hypothetical protein